MTDNQPKDRKYPEANDAEAGEPATEEPADNQDDASKPPVRPLRPGQFGYDRDQWP